MPLSSGKSQQARAPRCSGKKKEGGWNPHTRPTRPVHDLPNDLVVDPELVLQKVYPVLVFVAARDEGKPVEGRRDEHPELFNLDAGARAHGGVAVYPHEPAGGAVGVGEAAAPLRPPLAPERPRPGAAVPDVGERLGRDQVDGDLEPRGLGLR